MAENYVMKLCYDNTKFKVCSGNQLMDVQY